MPRFVGRGPGADRDCNGLGPGLEPDRHGLGRCRRLTRHAEFVFAQRSGRRVTTAHFLLLVAARPGTTRAGTTSPARLGIVTSRKVGGAVQRNRVRRLCRECFRCWPDFLPAGVDLVVIARPGASALGLATVQAEWRAVEAQVKKRAREALARGDTPTHLGGGKTC